MHMHIYAVDEYCMPTAQYQIKRIGWSCIFQHDNDAMENEERREERRSRTNIMKEKKERQTERERQGRKTHNTRKEEKQDEKERRRGTITSII